MKKDKFMRVRRILSSKYPVFKTQMIDNKERFQPLAVGIREQLFAVETDVSRTEIRQFLRKWTSKVGYHLAVLHGKRRYDLQGEMGELISQDHKTAAQVALDERKKARGDGKSAPRGKAGGQVRFRKSGKFAASSGPRRVGGDERTLRLRG